MAEVGKPGHIKLQMAVQRQGFASRREAWKLIRNGQVKVNGAICDDPELEFEKSGLELEVANQVLPYKGALFLMLDKPEGLECSHNPQHNPSVYSLFPEPFLRRGLQTVGRLDAETSGLLLLTDSGKFNHHLCSPRHAVTRTYLAKTRHPVDENMVGKLREGVELRDEKQVFKAVEVEVLDSQTLRIVISEGKYHQVRRMIAAAGNRVESLRRMALGALQLDVSLAPGKWRYITREEIAVLGYEMDGNDEPV